MSITRLISIQAANDSAGAEMLIEAARFDRIRGTKPRAVSAFNLFQTLVHLAARMVAMIPAGVQPRRILDPSAGLGRLYRAALSRWPGAAYTLVENAPQCAAELWRLPVEFMQRDFLTVEGGQYDFIIMNPPFHMRADIRHIKHAAGMLAPGGTLVAICMAGPQREEQLRPLCSTWEALPAGTFRSEGTAIDTVLLTIKSS
jgi:SAM-dependent methyltransferase